MNARITPAPAQTELDAFWMPFTANRQFKGNPRLLARAEGMHYWTADGRQVLDGVAGLWCVNAGHGRREITEAVAQAARHHGISRPPSRWAIPSPSSSRTGWRRSHRPAWTGCSSPTRAPSPSTRRSKIAIAYHRARGQGQRTRLIGREKGYHGVGFGGMSVGGMVNNRKFFAGALLPSVDHLPHTLDLGHNAFSRGLPHWGMHLANELERLIALHDASNIAAVIVEPIAGSAGVILPPVGYLEAPARDLRQARHLVDIRRGDHGIRPRRQAVRRAGLRGDPRPHDDRQGTHQRRDPDGRGVRAAQDLRCLHAGAGERDRAVPRLHLLRASGRLRRGARDARHLRARGAAHPGRRSSAPNWQEAVHSIRGARERDRHPQLRVDRRGRAGAAAGQARRARLRGVLEVLRARRHGAGHRAIRSRCRRR